MSSKSVNLEKIIAAAIDYGDYYGHHSIAIVPRPGRHCDIIQFWGTVYGIHTNSDKIQGFLTSEGRFVGRAEAKKIAQEAGQCRETEQHQLYSEDLW